jgi:hypothetical protein
MFDAFTPSASDVGFVIDWFPTETIRPTESLHDGGIIIEGGFPTETIRPMESLHDGGDLPLNCHPAAARASANVTPFGAMSVPA